MPDLERRSLGSAIAIPLIMSVMAAAMAFMWVAYVTESTSEGKGFMALVTDLGRAASKELNAGLAVTATIQFGVIVATVGNQIVATRAKDEIGIRSGLFVLAMASGAVLTPAVIFAVIAAFSTPGIAGGLLVGAPLYCVQLGMSMFIASFEPGAAPTLLVVAKQRAMEAKEISGAWSKVGCPSSMRSALLLIATLGVVCIPTIMATGVLTWVGGLGWRGVVAGTGMSSRDLWVTCGAISALYFLGVITALGVNFSCKPPADKSGRVVFIILWVLEIVLLLGIVLMGWSGLNLLSVGVLVSTVFLIGLFVSALMEASRMAKFIGIISDCTSGQTPPHFSPPHFSWWLGGGLTGVGTAIACASARAAERSTQKRVEELTDRVSERYVVATAGDDESESDGAPRLT